MRIGDGFVMYYVAMTREPNACAVAYAVSTDLVHWQDRGPALTQPVSLEVGQAMMESPCVVEANGRWHLFYTQARGLNHAVSDSPFAFDSPRFFCSTHASEVFSDEEGGWLISNVNKAVGYSHTRGNERFASDDLSLARLVFVGDEPQLRPILESNSL